MPAAIGLGYTGARLCVAGLRSSYFGTALATPPARRPLRVSTHTAWHACSNARRYAENSAEALTESFARLGRPTSTMP
eukprot:4604794-Pleurochrysis_carterae.AAC.2